LATSATISLFRKTYSVIVERSLRVTYNVLWLVTKESTDVGPFTSYSSYAGWTFLQTSGIRRFCSHTPDAISLQLFTPKVVDV
jgi:hypothetical protein